MSTTQVGWRRKEGKKEGPLPGERQDPCVPHTLSCCSRHELPFCSFASHRHCMKTSWSIPVLSMNQLADTAISQTSRPLRPSLKHLPLTGNVHVPYYHLTPEISPISLTRPKQTRDTYSTVLALRLARFLRNILTVSSRDLNFANPSSWQGTREGASPLKEAAF